MKRYEARTWSTPYRGEVAVHASATIKPWVREFLEEEPLFRRALRKAAIPDIDDLPCGAVIGSVVVREVQRMREVKPRLTKESLALCAYPSNAYFLWRLEDPKELPVPIPTAGKLNLWTLPEDIASRAKGRLRRLP